MFSKRINLIKKASILALLITVSALILSACSFNAIRGNGKITNLELQVVEDIKKIEVKNVPVILNVSAEKNEKVTYKADENLKDLLNVEINNGLLKISSKSNKKLWFNSKIVFNIGTDTLEEISIDSGAEIKGAGTFTSDTFTINVDGATKLNMNLDSDKVILKVNGAASVNLVGKTKDFEITGGGAFDVKCKELKADSVLINYDGTVNMEVYANTRLTVKGAGVYYIKYWGNAVVYDEGYGYIQKHK